MLCSRRLYTIDNWLSPVSLKTEMLFTRTDFCRRQPFRQEIFAAIYSWNLRRSQKLQKTL